MDPREMRGPRRGGYPEGARRRGYADHPHHPEHDDHPGWRETPESPPREGHGHDWRGHHHGGPDGPHGRRTGHGARVGRGDVRAAALALLAETPLHGYQIIQQIAERSGGVWRPSPGSVYPALQLLEDEGLIAAEQVESRRVFRLTDAGRAYVAERQTELAAVFSAVADTVDDGRRQLRDLYEQLGAALAQVARAGTAPEIAEAAKLLVTARRQLYRILADAGSDETQGATTPQP